MCEPATLAWAAFAIAGASTAMQVVSATQQAEVQTEMYNRNTQAANKAAADEMADIQLRLQQERETVTQQQNVNSVRARQEAAAAYTAGAERGATGLTMDALLGDIYGQSAATNDTLGTNLEWTGNSLARAVDGTRAKATDRINSMTPGTGPSYIAAALRIGGAGVNAAVMRRQLEPK